MKKIKEQIINGNHIDIDDFFESEWIDYQRDYLVRFMDNSMVSGYVITNKEKFIKSIMNKKNVEKIEKKCGFTMQQMCEHIVKSDILQFKNDKASPTAEEIFNYSPTGELYMVFQWFNEACDKIGLPTTN